MKLLYTLIFSRGVILTSARQNINPDLIKTTWIFDHAEPSATEKSPESIAFFTKDFIGLQWQFSNSLRIVKSNGEKRTYSYSISNDNKVINMNDGSQSISATIIELEKEKLILDIGKTFPLLVFKKKI